MRVAYTRFSRLLVDACNIAASRSLHSGLRVALPLATTLRTHMCMYTKTNIYKPYMSRMQRSYSDIGHLHAPAHARAYSTHYPA